MQEDQPLKPANILNIVATNQGKIPLTKEYPKAKALTAVQVKEMMVEGCGGGRRPFLSHLRRRPHPRVDQRAALQQ
jgi:hypothetical protein